MPNVINTCTNRKEIEIQRDGEKVGVIYFDPADMAIIKRLREAQDKLAEVTIKTDKDADVETMLAEADRIDAELRKAVDYAFDYPCSDVVFGNGYCFTTAKGVTALEQFLKGAIDIVSTEMKAEADAAKKRQDKYLGKYKK